jgi:hypothetical protein
MKRKLIIIVIKKMNDKDSLKVRDKLNFVIYAEAVLKSGS